MRQGIVADFMDYTRSNQICTNLLDNVRVTLSGGKEQAIACREGYAEPGRYVLRTDGVGTVWADNKTCTFTGAGERYIFEFKKAKGLDTRFRLGILENNAEKPIRFWSREKPGNIYLHPEGIEPESTVFHPKYLADVAGCWAYRSIHFEPIELDDKLGLEGGRWDVFPLAWMERYIDLCNQVGMRPWYNVHHRSDEECCRNIGALFREKLAPGLSPIWAYGNECWHWVQPYIHGYNFVKNEGPAVWGSSNINGNYGCFAGRAIKWMQEEFRRPSTWCLEGQIAIPGGTVTAFNAAKAAGYDFHAFASAPYAVANSYPWPMLDSLWKASVETSDEVTRKGLRDVVEKLVCDAMWDGVVTRTEPLMKAWYDNCQANRVMHLAYEWGWSLFVDTRIPGRDDIGLHVSGSEGAARITRDLSQLMGKYYAGGCHCGHIGKWGGGVNFFGLKTDLGSPNARWSAWRDLVDRFDP